MSCNTDAQSPQLLYQTPNFGAANANFIGNLGSAHHYRGVRHQQPNDPLQAGIGFLQLWC
jgi:hypothetical protein